MWRRLNKNAKSMKHLALGAVVPHPKDDPVAMALLPYQFTVNLLHRVAIVNENRIQKLMKQAGIQNNHANIHDHLMELMSRGVVTPEKLGYSMTKEFRDFIQEQKEHLDNNAKQSVPTGQTGSVSNDIAENSEPGDGVDSSTPING